MRTLEAEFRSARFVTMLAALAVVSCAGDKSSDDDLPQVGGGTSGATGVAGQASSSGGAPSTTGGTGGTGTAGDSATGTGGSGGTSGSATASGGMPATGGGTTGGGAGTAAQAGSGGAGGSAGTTSGTGGGGSGGAAAGKSGTAGGGGSAGTSVEPGDHSVEGTCARWNADRADMSEGTWSGNLDSCDPGDISADGRANALRLFNLYRWMADMPEVTTSDDRNLIAQACALLMDKNNMLSHDPPEDWDCWSDDAHEGASQSNISSGPGVSSVDLYMVDNGNEDTLGHRRWIMSNSLGPIGLGSTGAMGSSCMQNLTGTGKAGKAWIAWPPAGVLPVQAVAPNRFGDTLDQTGWLIQSDSIDLGDATVTVTSGGAEVAVDVFQLPGGYGSRYALRIVPNGWTTTAGQTYSVSVGGTSTPIAYDVVVADCEM